jgi:hypothetical protein
MFKLTTTQLLRVISVGCWSLLVLCQSAMSATHFISDQMPEGTTLADFNLGERPLGPSERAVRLVELATLPGAGQVQQIVARETSLFVVLKEGRIWEYDLQGNVATEPFLDVDELREDFNDYSGWAASRGLRGFAFHPDYDTNGLVYTIHKEDPDGSEPDYGTDYLDSEFVLAEWNFNQLIDGAPTFRQIFRIRFEHHYHLAQQLGFNPVAQPGDPDYGLLYAGFGDNGTRTGGVQYESQIRNVSDVSNVGQNFETIQSGVIRIDPLDPSELSDSQLLANGRKRSVNGNFSIPLDNPFVGHSTYREELFAKGFRNPLTLSFSPAGAPVVADVGEQTVEEINVLVSGGNYGWPNREGTFLVAWADQTDGSPLGADASMRWMPAGDASDPAVTFYVRDKNQENLTVQTLARAGPHADSFAYPVFQFTHEGNNTNGQLNGLAAVVGGDFYTGFWAQELEGLYLFGNLSTDQIFYGATSELDAGTENAEIFELPLIDSNGDPIALAAIVGNIRANMRFGKDIYGNMYLASKTNGKLYRLQGRPKLTLASEPSEVVSEAEDSFFEFSFDRPPLDASASYTLEVSHNLTLGFTPAEPNDYSIVSTEPLADGRERIRLRYLDPVDPQQPRFFRIACATE